MPIAITTKLRIPYVLNSERAKESATTFYIRPLSAREVVANKGAEGFQNVDHFVACGLVGWANFKDNDGADVPFDVTKANELLAIEAYKEIAMAIMKESVLLESDAKNLESPPDSM